MIVLDASAAVELLLRLPRAGAVAERVLRDGEDLHAPHLLDLEILSVLRRAAAAGAVSSEQGAEVLALLADLRIERHGHAPLIGRIWTLGHHLTAYDAPYVALAEALDAPLVTLDRRLAAAPGHHARVEVLAADPSPGGPSPDAAQGNLGP